MADKIVFPPQVSGADALVELLTSPQVFHDRLTALKEAEDRIVLRLADLNTKAKADDYLVQARTALAEAEVRVAKVEEREARQRVAEDKWRQKLVRIREIIEE